MRKVFPYPITFEDEGVIYVKEEGVKWLYENYSNNNLSNLFESIIFKRDYLRELEKYKWELENRRNSLKSKTR